MTKGAMLASVAAVFAAAAVAGDAFVQRLLGAAATREVRSELIAVVTLALWGAFFLGLWLGGPLGR